MVRSSRSGYTRVISATCVNPVARSSVSQASTKKADGIQFSRSPTYYRVILTDSHTVKPLVASLALSKPQNPTKRAVHEWVQSYARGAHEATKHIKIPVGEELVCDELTIKLEGRRYWLWNAMDRDSRFVVATHLTPKRGAHAASILFRKVKEASTGNPKFHSDRRPACLC